LYFIGLFVNLLQLQALEQSSFKIGFSDTQKQQQNYTNLHKANAKPTWILRFNG
jgi:hypothetical protein